MSFVRVIVLLAGIAFICLGFVGVDSLAPVIGARHGVESSEINLEQQIQFTDPEFYCSPNDPFDDCTTAAAPLIAMEHFSLRNFPDETHVDETMELTIAYFLEDQMRAYEKISGAYNSGVFTSFTVRISLGSSALSILEPVQEKQITPSESVTFRWQVSAFEPGNHNIVVNIEKSFSSLEWVARHHNVRVDRAVTVNGSAHTGGQIVYPVLVLTELGLTAKESSILNIALMVAGLAAVGLVIKKSWAMAKRLGSKLLGKDAAQPASARTKTQNETTVPPDLDPPKAPDDAAQAGQGTPDGAKPTVTASENAAEPEADQAEKTLQQEKKSDGDSQS